MKRFTITILIILAVLVVGYYVSDDFNDFYNNIVKDQIQQSDILEQKVITSSPLEGPTEERQSTLTVSGTIEQTNIQREENGLPSLSINTQLNRAAEMKVDDMFNRQYFEHESPTGEGPGDLATSAGYEYILVGENLALGNYKDDQALVEAWMNSPGHRANILNEKYTEIGVSVKKGVYQGRNVWLAVQEFGRPMSLCPNPSESLNDQIDNNQIEIEKLEEELLIKKQEIDNTKPKRGEEYNQKVDEYNNLVNQYNNLVKETKNLISEYNNQVSEFNACIKL